VSALIHVLVIAGQCLLGVPAVAFSLETLLGAWPARRSPKADLPAGYMVLGRSSTVAVVVPAHNERLGIVATIQSLQAQLRPGIDRLLVVADNCSDDTAALARAAGAQVTERTNLQQRGKGHALDHGLQQLAADPPDLVLFVDADCQLMPGAVGHLRAMAEQTMRPVQACYLMNAPQGAGASLRVAALAWMIKNQVRPLGAARLGWPCQLTGSGMMFRWQTAQGAPIASGHITEDMQLGVTLAVRGLPPLFCPEAVLTSQFPLAKEAQLTQRTRWEHGHLGMITDGLPKLLKAALTHQSWGLLGMALSLGVPPLTSLVMMLGFVAVLSLILAFWAGTWGVALAPLISLMLVSVAVFVAWWRLGRHIIGGRELLSLPLYLLAKVPIYAGYFARRQTGWVRTGRDDELP